jgi:hypothetical protein
MKTSNRNIHSCFSFDLLFEHDPLSGSSAHIVLHSCSKGEDGTTYLTPECVTPAEFAHQIDRLIAELENLRNRGLRNFIKAVNGGSRHQKQK